MGMTLRLALIAAILGGTVAAAPVSAAGCEYSLGFKTLHDGGPATFGECVDNARYVANGDAVQDTTRGLMTWRKADGRMAFTDGTFTWILGPNGLVSRRNSERFRWETIPGPRDNPIPLGQQADIGSGLTLSVQYVVQDAAWLAGFTSDPETLTADGFQLLLAGLRVTNGGSGKVGLDGDSAFRAASARPRAQDYAPATSCGAYPDRLPVVELAPGTSTAGTVCFVVAQADVAGLELYYRNPSPLEGRLYFWLVPALG